MKKRFSVIIAVYNGEELIRQAIDSVLEQTFTDYELIVVDDGSTDRTQDILQSYGARIKLVRKINQGPEVAYITGVSHSVGEYMAFLDSDDYFLPNALATYDSIITALDFPPLVIGAYKVIEKQDVKIDAGSMDGDIKVFKYRDYLSKDVRIRMSQSMIVMKKTLFEEVQKGRGIHHAGDIMNDYGLILRAGTFGPCVIVSRPITIVYRVHPTQLTKNIEEMCRGVLSLIDMVSNGQTAAGRSRWFDRYAYLGGPVSEWSRKALKAQRFELAFRIVMKGWKMVVVNQINKFFLLFHNSSTAVDIADE